MTAQTASSSPLFLAVLALAGRVAGAPVSEPPPDSTEPAGQAGAGAIDPSGDPDGMIGTDVVDLEDKPGPRTSESSRAATRAATEPGVRG